MKTNILFYRNTHDENGKYRGDDFFKNNEGKIYSFTEHSLVSYTGAHTFDSGVPYTFNDYYVSLCELAAGGAYDTPPEEIKVEDALRDLATLVEYKLVRVEIPTEMTLDFKKKVVCFNKTHSSTDEDKEENPDDWVLVDLDTGHTKPLSPTKNKKNR